MNERIYLEDTVKFYVNSKRMMEELKKRLAEEGIGDMEIEEINEPARLKRWLMCKYHGMRIEVVGWDDTSYYWYYAKNYIDRTVMALKWEIKKQEEIERMKAEKAGKGKSIDERMAEAPTPKPYVLDEAKAEGGDGK